MVPSTISIFTLIIDYDYQCRHNSTACHSQQYTKKQTEIDVNIAKANKRIIQSCKFYANIIFLRSVYF